MSCYPPPVPRLARRTILATGLALAAAQLAPRLTAQAHAGDAAPQHFSFDLLTEEMRALAAAPHVPAPRIEGPLADLDYDDYRLLRFRPDRRRAAGNGFEFDAFAPGWLFREPVALFLVSGGQAVPVTVRIDDFELLNDLGARLGPIEDLPGVAGFRLFHPLNHPEVMDELVSFLGASYFRALGRGSVYGVSARGLALNTATAEPEEFPRFSRFYIEPEEGFVTVHAALESPSVTGAYRFVIRPGATTTMDVTCRLFFRTAVGELGIAPLTSMFLYDGKNRALFDDFRPQVHDSDGLRIVRANGDVAWRPLANPPRLAGSYFSEISPRRFGLHQRARRFETHQDSEALYHRRPSLDVEPLGEWGKGHVRLVEIPSESETNDNIVAYWVPEQPVQAGDTREFAYRLHWGDLPPDTTDLAIVDETRAGHGGVSGVAAPADVRKFVVDFRGGLPERLGADARIEAVVGVTGGTVLVQTLKWLPDARMWRVALDVEADAAGIVEMQIHLAGYGRRLSEEWVYQWVKRT